MLPYMEKGTVIKLKIFDGWGDYSGLSGFLMRKRGRQELRKRCENGSRGQSDVITDLED